MQNNQGDSEDYQKKEQEAMLEQMVEQAAAAAAKGENIDQLLDVMLSLVTGKQKEVLKVKFAAALKKRGLKQAIGDADIPSHNVLDRIRNALAISAKQAFDRVLALVRAKPDIADRIHQAGEILARNGVMIERIQVSEAELGNIVPTAISKTQNQTSEIGR